MMNLILDILRCYLILDTFGLSITYQHENVLQAGEQTYSPEAQRTSMLTKFTFYSLHLQNKLSKSIGVNEIDHGEYIEGDKNKAKGGTWKTTTLKRQKEHPGEDSEKEHLTRLNENMMLKKSKEERI